MGHLINIVKDIVQQCKQSEGLDKFLKDNLSPECLNKWEKLAKIKKLRAPLVRLNFYIITKILFKLYSWYEFSEGEV